MPFFVHELFFLDEVTAFAAGHRPCVSAVALGITNFVMLGFLPTMTRVILLFVLLKWIAFFMRSG